MISSVVFLHNCNLSAEIPVKQGRGATLSFYFALFSHTQRERNCWDNPMPSKYHTFPVAAARGEGTRVQRP